LRLYLEPSVLVKLFKREPDSEKMINVVGAVDERRDWFGCTSRWSLLEVARALKKDGKPKELIELNLKELRRHRISFIDVTRTVLSDAERILASHNLYASDALHAATFTSAAHTRRLNAMLTDDRHIQRLDGIVRVANLSEITIKPAGSSA
jgi:predicted nucleic acid-binding protein